MLVRATQPTVFHGLASLRSVVPIESIEHVFQLLAWEIQHLVSHEYSNHAIDTTHIVACRRLAHALCVVATRPVANTTAAESVDHHLQSRRLRVAVFSRGVVRHIQTWPRTIGGP